MEFWDVRESIGAETTWVSGIKTEMSNFSQGKE